MSKKIGKLNSNSILSLLGKATPRVYRRGLIVGYYLAVLQQISSDERHHIILELSHLSDPQLNRYKRHIFSQLKTEKARIDLLYSMIWSSSPADAKFFLAILKSSRTPRLLKDIAFEALVVTYTQHHKNYQCKKKVEEALKLIEQMPNAIPKTSYIWALNLINQLKINSQ